MKLIFFVICFVSSFSYAGFLSEIGGDYKTIPGIPDECEKDNAVIKCDSQIDSMEIRVVDESKMEISVVVNNDPLNPLSVGCGNYEASEGSILNHSSVVQTAEMIVCTWITNSAPYFPSMRRIEFKKFNESVIEYRISNEYKGNIFPWGKFYWQNGVSSSLEKKKRQ